MVLHTVSDPGAAKQLAIRSIEKAQNELPRQEPDIRRVAILLNRNARQVTPRKREQIKQLIGSEHIYESGCLAEGEVVCRELVQKGYGTIASGGGDGTMTKTFNLVHTYISEVNRWRIERYRRFGEKQALLGMPRFAFLKLGTGNGIGTIIGARSPNRDLKQIIDYAPLRQLDLPMINFNKESFYFGGIGFEAMLLEDYRRLNQRIKNPFIKSLLTGLPGYFIAGLSRTAPRTLRNPRTLNTRIITRTPAYYIDPRRGDTHISIPAGTVLFEGAASVISMGTCPYLGRRIRMFPFVGSSPKHMQLRIATFTPLGVLWNMRKLWQGTYRNSSTMLDFLVDDIRIELEKPSAFQHSGDEHGRYDTLDLQVSNTPMTLVDYLPPKIL